MSHFAGVTVTCCPLTADSAFHRELSLAPDGRSNSSFQVFSVAPLLFVTTYWAVYPVDQSLVFVYAAPTPAACAVPVRRTAPPPTTAAATTPPMTLFLPLTLCRCMLMARHASEPESGKVPDPGGG